MQKPRIRVIQTRPLTPERLMELAQMGSSVWVSNWNKRHPASFFMSWHFSIVIKNLKNGNITEVLKDAKA